MDARLDRRQRGAARASLVLSVVLVFAAAAGFGWLCWRVYRARVAPETLSLDATPRAWSLGPGPAALKQRAEEHMERGLAALSDRTRPAGERVSLYRAELTLAEELLVASLTRQASQAEGLAMLAAVRWELAQPPDAQTERRTSDTIALASSLAPTDPRVQLRLGELLLRMGRPDEAGRYFERAATLEPGLGAEIVERMRRHLLDAGRILDLLPPEPTVLAALHRPALDEGLGPRLREIAETRLRRDAPASPELLHAYGNVCLELGEPARLRETLEAIGEQPTAESEAARLRQRSRALLALAAPQAALDDARAAFARSATPPYAEHLGDVLLETGSAGEAIRSFHRALTLVAGASANEQTRARLYRKIGQAEETGGDPGEAYDAYRRAVELDPSEPFARRRVDEMESAAGI